MVLQMTQIGEESGSLDDMLGKVADFFEREVDDAVAALSSLLEPIIIVFLGVVIGGLVVAMYLPIFKLGAVDLTRAGIAARDDRAAFLLDPGGGARSSPPSSGLCVGSFLNVVIHRLPKMLERGWQDAVRRACAARRPRRGRATTSWCRARRCPSCGHGITALREHPGACRGSCCAASARPAARAISARYPLVELLGGAARRRRRSGASARRGRRSPRARSCGRCSRSRSSTSTRSSCPTTSRCRCCGRACSPTCSALFVPLREAVIGAIAGYLVAVDVYWLFKLIRGKEGMGYGDFKLLAALGAWLGWQMLPLIVLVSSVVGAVDRHQRWSCSRAATTTCRSPSGPISHRRRDRAVLRAERSSRCYFPA